MPPRLHNEKGEIRKVGFEIEFGGLELEDAARCVVDIFGGKLKKINHFLLEVSDTDLGTFHLRMDARDLTEMKYAETLEKFGIDSGSETISAIVESISSIIIPYEVDSPPVKINEIERIDALRKALHQNKARGAKENVLNLYAMHINAEIPCLDIKTLLGYTKAFLLLYPWLYEKADIALGRRMAHFIRPFPEVYINLAVHPAYNPDKDVFIDDYHKYNPDRNRPLDLYPLLACLHKEKIDSLPDVGKLNPRPAFHYRLPNSLVNEKEWSLATDWNLWVEVERLADDEKALYKLGREYLDMQEDSYFGFTGKWVQHIEEWLKNQG